MTKVPPTADPEDVGIVSYDEGKNWALYDCQEIIAENLSFEEAVTRLDLLIEKVKHRKWEQ